MSFLKNLAARTKQVLDEATEAAVAKYEELKVSEEIREERYAICKQCPSFIEMTTTCTECGCFMAAKTYIGPAKCPVGKWMPITIIKQES